MAFLFFLHRLHNANLFFVRNQHISKILLPLSNSPPIHSDCVYVYFHTFYKSPFYNLTILVYLIGISIVSVVKLHEYPILVHVSRPILASFQTRYDTDV